ncbi:hypothetical protein IWQ60_000161 [Tieghemiomyces parasiticus]|uniref:ENTH domain-containing protein n=1 Tax=Tieghemiomyces parasiticus TaxID=78921 RepID=A0A9W8E327_9FUNG|nr:hypothetical protein IWQ60_000161 [Tieghemiomyces parasiticus]
MEKAVFKATNKDCVTPKRKHVERLVQLTWSDALTMPELFMVIEGRFSEPSWVITFKTLIVVHLLLLEGDSDKLFKFLSRNQNVLDLHQFRDKNGTRSFDQSKNIRLYAHYLVEKVNTYRDLRVDFVRDKYPSSSQINGDGPVDISRLLHEIAMVQRQIYVLLKAKFFIDTVDNEVTFSAFRLLINELLKLFQTMNAGVIKMLKNYFIISYDDMKRCLELYKRFVKITDRVTDFLDNGRQLQSAFGMSIPQLNHAPVSLAISLEQYLGTPEAHLPVEEKLKNSKQAGPTRMAKTSTAPAKSVSKKPSFNTLPRQATAPAPPKEPMPVRSATMARSSTAPQPVSPNTQKNQSQRDLIDFFASIEGEVVPPPANPSAGPSTLNVLTPTGAAPAFATNLFQPQAPYQAQPQSATVANPFLGNTDSGALVVAAQPPPAPAGGTATHNPFTQRQTMYELNSMSLPSNTVGSGSGGGNNFLALPAPQAAPATLSHNPFTQRQSMYTGQSMSTQFHTISSNPFAPAGGQTGTPASGTSTSDPFTSLFAPDSTVTQHKQYQQTPTELITTTTTTALAMRNRTTYHPASQFQTAYGGAGTPGSQAPPPGSGFGGDATQPLFAANFDLTSPPSAPASNGNHQAPSSNPFNFTGF